MGRRPAHLTAEEKAILHKESRKRANAKYRETHREELMEKRRAAYDPAKRREEYLRRKDIDRDARNARRRDRREAHREQLKAAAAPQPEYSNHPSQPAGASRELDDEP